MGEKSAIGWTDSTWNPLTGCSHCSPGCDGCYAARDAYGRLKGNHRYAGLAVKRSPDELPRFTGEVRLWEDRLEEPLHWRAPRRVFVNSQSDLFHPDVPFDFIVKVFDTMRRAPQHQFQILTKRPQRMRQVMEDRMATPAEVSAGHELGIFPGVWDVVSSGMPLPNVRLGASIESDRYAWRADHVRRTEAAATFLSLEPLLGPLPSLDVTGIGWVIVGGESGARARPMDPDWARDLRDRCRAAGVPFFMKQMGAVWARANGVALPAHRIDEFPLDLQIQETP